MPRLETILGGIFFAALIVGFGPIIYAANRLKSTRENRNGQVFGIGLWAFAFLFWGLASIYFSKTSQRPTMTGSITKLKQFTGKYPSSDFTVLAKSGETASIHSQYNGRGLQSGDIVTVQYVLYDETLLHLTVESGQEAGWELEESDQTLWSGLIDIVGVAFGIAAFREWRKALPDPEDDGKPGQPDTDGPDPGSMLKFS